MFRENVIHCQKRFYKDGGKLFRGPCVVDDLDNRFHSLKEVKQRETLLVREVRLIQLDGTPNTWFLALAFGNVMRKNVK